MTLYRQLLLFILILILTLFTVSWVTRLQATKTYLQQQLQSHAQDTATSLGLTISAYSAQDDIAAAETIINTIFDRGYYRLIVLKDLDGLIRVKRSMEVALDTVPPWFIHLVPLEPPRATARVMDGWFQAGTIVVESHPGFAYISLWDTTVSMTCWYLLLAALACLAGGIGLRLLLRPLARVEDQARALSQRRFEIQEPIPRTRELRQVVQAMNQMTLRVKTMFEEQARTAQQLRRQAYSDPLTRLGNRRYLENQVVSRTDRPGTEIRGTFLLVHITGLRELNEKKGFKAGDARIQTVADILRTGTEDIPGAAVARLTGGDFGVFLPDTGLDEASQVADAICQRLWDLGEKHHPLAGTGSIGGVVFTKKTSFSTLLAGADSAMQAASSKGPNQWVIRRIPSRTEDLTRGRIGWKKVLEQAIAEEDIVLFGQACVALDDPQRILHREILARLRKSDGGLLRAEQFVPLTHRLGLITRLDRSVVEKAMALTRDEAGADQLAINISPVSLADRPFTNWLLARLEEDSRDRPRFIFEFTEFSAVRHLELLAELGRRIRDLGHGYGIDHFGQGFANFGYLKSLQPDYVKIDRAFTRELVSAGSDSHFFIHSLCSVAHSLGIAVHGEGVETKDQHLLLSGLSLDGLQGYYLDHPREIA
ncbi:bifunctional diguanylate cyclase/phosphodiesterase [Desulfolithobacter sp.]